MMTDLARQAMEKIAEIVGDRFEDADVEVLRAGINSVGTLVSHEDAALMREMERLKKSATDVEIVRNKRGWFVSLATDSSEVWHTGDDDTLTAALKSALDAAGDPCWSVA